MASRQHQDNVQEDGPIGMEDCLRMVENNLHEWTPSEGNGEDYIDWAHRRFKNSQGIVMNKSDMNVAFWELKNSYSDRILEARKLFQRALRSNLFELKKSHEHRDQRAIDLSDNFSKWFQLISFTYYAVESYRRTYNITNNLEGFSEKLPLETSLFRCSTIDIDAENLKPHQQLILHILRQLYSDGLARYQGKIFKQIKVEDPTTGHNYETRAWELYMEIKDYIRNATRKEVMFAQWKNATEGDSLEKCAKYLENAVDYEFPLLKPDRHIFSFKNGIFNASTISFIEFKPDVPIPRDITASTYFDLHFPKEWIDSIAERKASWWDIPTPYFQSIVEYQRMGDGDCSDRKSERRKVIKWLYRFIGRLLFDVNEKDGWQVAPFIKGIAGSGKSTIGKLCTRFYPFDDVGTLSSSAEEKFGLAAIMHKKMFVCMEAKSKFNIPQSEVQSLISGENMNIPIKFKTAESKIWIVPGIFFGNEIPTWIDSQGSMTRRIVLWEFLRRVENSNPRMDEKLDGERAYMLLKCAIAYVLAAEKHGDKNIWELKCLPNYFRATQKRFSMQINPFFSFLEDETLFEICHRDFDNKKDPEDLNSIAPRYIAKDDLKKMFKDFLSNNNMSSRITFNEDLYRNIFSNYNIKEEVDVMRFYHGELKKGTYFIGIGKKLDQHEESCRYDYTRNDERKALRKKYQDQLNDNHNAGHSSNNHGNGNSNSNGNSNNNNADHYGLEGDTSLFNNNTTTPSRMEEEEETELD